MEAPSFQRPQPNFERISGAIENSAISLQTAADELKHCINLPVVQQGDQFQQLFLYLERMEERITQKFTVQMQQMEERLIQRMDDKMEQLEQRLDGKIDALKIQIQSTNYNVSARLANHWVNKGHHELEPLVAIATNVPIVGFPETINALNGLSQTEVRRILEELGLPTHGTLPQKRQRLKMAIGATLHAS
ncbi:hypothetical protein F4802DRAFT_602201 [Xylaria palmicola]|nr:hypothetical protein F4802DRAFT_602201 [Xylaria palmicola]